jgi:dolichol-phosphate mannosyltransferase
MRGRLEGLAPGLVQLIRFGIVGGLGTLTNLALFFVLVDLFGLGALLGLLVCFAVAVSQNYALNELWTFATQGDGRLAWARYWKFVLSSLVGLAVNAVVLLGLMAFFTFPLLVLPQAIGIAAGMAVNFIASRSLVFQRS